MSHDYVFLKQNNKVRVMPSSFKRVTLQTKIFGVGGFCFTLFVSFANFWTYIIAGTWQNMCLFLKNWILPDVDNIHTAFVSPWKNPRQWEIFMFSWLALTPETYVTLSITTFLVLRGILCLSESSDALRYCRKAVKIPNITKTNPNKTPRILQYVFARSVVFSFIIYVLRQSKSSY